MSRIQTIFDKLKQHKRKALIPFFTAGDPHPKFTVPLLHALVEAGADVIELGVPFSDPMADGPIIQRASERALKHHVGLHHVLDMVAEFRRSNAGTPIVLMGYGNPIEAMGWEAFAKRCARSMTCAIWKASSPRWSPVTRWRTPRRSRRVWARTRCCW